MLPMQKLCSGDWDRTLKFSVYDWNRLVGQFAMAILVNGTVNKTVFSIFFCH